MKKYLIVFVLICFPLTSSAFFDVSLKFGSKGEAVIELQEFLQDQEYLKGSVDGKFGFGTLKAVKAFQKDQGLKVDGYFGKGSREKAKSILDELLKDSNVMELEETGTIQPIFLPLSAPSFITTQVPQTINELPKQENIASDLGVFPTYTWYNHINSVWIATTGTRKGDIVSLTINNQTTTKIVESVSGKQSIWSGFSVENLDRTVEHPVELKVQRGNEYQVLTLKVKSDKNDNQ